MMRVLKEFGAPFYDGCIVVGIVDYRKGCFGSIMSAGGGVGPEMHKILLKPTYQTIIADLEFINEAQDSENLLELESQMLVSRISLVQFILIIVGSGISNLSGSVAISLPSHFFT